MPTFEIPDHFSKHFTTNVELLLQETKPVMLEGVMTSSYRGEAAQVIKQFGEVEFTEKTGRHSDTVFSDIEHKQRWVFPTDYTLTLPVDKEDDLRALNSPTSSYAEAMRAAWARKVNATIRDALLGNSQTGTNGSTVTPFDTVNQQIAPNATGLTLDKLRAARKIFTENFVEPSDKLFLTLNAKGTEDLLAVSEIGSIDYNAVKALVRGEVNVSEFDCDWHRRPCYRLGQVWHQLRYLEWFGNSNRRT